MPSLCVCVVLGVRWSVGLGITGIDWMSRKVVSVEIPTKFLVAGKSMPSRSQSTVGMGYVFLHVQILMYNKELMSTERKRKKERKRERERAVG